MKTVGLRELKNSLSRYVREVRSGKTIMVTDRGQVVAELTPPSSARAGRAKLAALARSGHLTLARPVPRGMREDLYPPLPKALRNTTAAELLDAVRAER